MIASTKPKRLVAQATGAASNVLTLLALLSLLPLDANAATPDQIRKAISQAGSPDRFINRMASQTASMAPRMLDAQTELTGATALGRTMVFYLRLVDYNKSEIADLAALRRTISNQNGPAVCSAPVASILINEHSAEYKYMVYSKSKEFLFDYAFNRTTCGSIAAK